MNQTELIKQMSDEELKRQLLLSQSIFFLISIILSFFLFSNISDWLHYISFDFKQIVLIGVLPALAIVLIEVILYVFVPARYFDDGGINEKVFRNQSIGSIFLISIVVAIAEES